jgi:hypothetical protein
MTLNHGCKYLKISCSKRRAEPHFGTVELAQFGIAKEDPMHVLIHLFQSDLFVAKDFANKNSTLMPANVSAVIHPPRLERSWVLKARYPAGQQSSTGHVDAPCARPDTYFYYHHGHPSTATHKAVGDKLYYDITGAKFVPVGK